MCEHKIQLLLIIKALKYLCINHGDQRVIFKLKKAYLALSASFEHLCYYGFMNIRNTFTLTEKVWTLNVRI